MTMISKPLTRGKSPKLITDDWRWQSLVRKDERADGLFWYSVKTTGVYCRPSCPARLPKRDNVAFHDSTQNAERAGFRACKRCGPKGSGLAGQHAEAVTTTCRMIKEADEFPSLKELAQAVKMSPGYFHRLFKTATGLTPKDYANAHRADRIKRALPKRETVRAYPQSAAVRWDRKLLRSHSGVLPGHLSLSWSSSCRSGAPGTLARCGGSTILPFASGKCMRKRAPNIATELSLHRPP